MLPHVRYILAGLRDVLVVNSAPALLVGYKWGKKVISEGASLQHFHFCLPSVGALFRLQNYANQVGWLSSSVLLAGRNLASQINMSGDEEYVILESLERAEEISTPSCCFSALKKSRLPGKRASNSECKPHDQSDSKGSKERGTSLGLWDALRGSFIWLGPQLRICNAFKPWHHQIVCLIHGTRGDLEVQAWHRSPFHSNINHA